MTMCNVKGVTVSYETTQNYHLTLQFGISVSYLTVQ